MEKYQAKGNIRAVLNLLTYNMENGTLLPNEETLNRTANKELRKAFANIIQKLRISCVKTYTIVAFLAFCLTQLDKDRGLRPTGVGEALRRIAGKVMVFLLIKYLFN